jgi:hypothetical protein
MRKSMSIKVGDVMRSSSCNNFTVISVDNSNSILVQFNDDFKYECRASTSTLKNGHVKNPYFGRLFGVGYLGVGKYQSRLGPASEGYANTQEYMSWVNMLSRCYYDKSTNRIKGYSSYDDTTVDKSWHNFQTFAEWFCEEKKRVMSIMPLINYALDKDILSTNARVYSSSTCCLIPTEINIAVKSLSTRFKDDKLCTLNLNKNKRYSIKFKIGRKSIIIENADTAKECMEFYLKYKEGYVHDLANKYKSVLTPNVYATLMSYKLPKRDALLIRSVTL